MVLTTVSFPPVTISEVCQACATGDLKKLEAWRDAKLLPKLMRADHLNWLPQSHAILHGQLSVLKWLHNDSGQRIDLTVDDNVAALLAADTGQLDILKWLVFDSGQPIDLTAASNRVAQHAAANNRLEVLRWLVNASGQAVDVTADSNYPLRVALRHHHYAVAEWLLFDSGQPVDVTDGDNFALRTAVSDQHFDTVDWIIRQSQQLPKILAKELYWVEKLPAALRQKIVTAQVVNSFLEQRHVPEQSRQPYLLSEVCVRAIASSLAESVADLDRLLAASVVDTRLRKKL